MQSLKKKLERIIFANHTGLILVYFILFHFLRKFFFKNLRNTTVRVFRAHLGLFFYFAPSHAMKGLFVRLFVYCPGTKAKGMGRGEEERGRVLRPCGLVTRTKYAVFSCVERKGMKGFGSWFYCYG